MSKKNIKINHTAVSNSINKYRILMIVFITAVMCVMSAGIGTAEDSNQAAPTLAGSYDTAGYAHGVALSGSYAYVADYDNGLVIVDISDPTIPTFAGSYDTAGCALGVAVSGSYAYVADNDNGLVIVDISNPTAPILAGSYNAAVYAEDVAVSGSYAYVTDFSNGLMIVDISNPVAPTLAGSYNTAGYGLGVAVSGSYAYVAGEYTGLVIVDISDPTAPTLAGLYDIGGLGLALDVAVSGNYAYVADDEEGFVIVDISNPAIPILAGSYNTAGYAYGIAVSGSYAYVADAENGLVIIGISDPAAPTYEGSIDTTGTALDVAVSGNYAYVADRDDGLVILRTNIESSNNAPVAFDQSVTTPEDTSVDITLSATDADGDALTYSIVDAPSHGTVTLSGNTATYTPDANYNGADSFTFKANDGTDDSNTAMVSITVAGVNNAPVADPNGPYTGTEGIPVTFDGSGSYDPDGSINSYDWYFGDENIGSGVNPSHTYAQDGIYTVTLTVTDNDGATDSNSTTVVVGNIAPTVDITLEGHFGGATYATAVSGNYAYIGQGQDLVVLDISNPSQPLELGRILTLGLIYDIKISGNYAYVADHKNGLVIVDISNPAAPTLTGSYDTAGYAHGVALSGSYAYVANGYYGLVIIDISNPAAPTLAGSYNPEGYEYVHGVAVSGSYAYVADDDNGLVIVDISNPAAPSFVGSYDTGGHGRDVAVSGSYAYVADEFDGLFIIDISDPAAPTLAGSYDTGGFAYGVAVSGSYAYLVGGYSGLVIVDISNPAAPILSGSYNTAGQAYGVTVEGSYAYVAGNNGLVIVDISNPVAPTFAGSYNTAGYAEGVAVSGSYAYVADGNNGLVVVDISNPAAPTLASNYDTAGHAYRVAVSGSYAYIVNMYNGLVIVDISNPAAPTLAGSYNPDGDAYAYDVAVSGSYAYVANGNYGLVIVDISNPAAPTLAGIYDTRGNARGVAVSGSYAYVADWSNGLVIIDISNPAVPTLAGIYNTRGDARGVAVSGSYVYVADWVDGLVIIDINNPTAPTLAGRYDTGYARGVAVSESYAYVDDYYGGLVVVDISNPADPTLADSYDTAGEDAIDVAVSGSYAYVADGNNGLVILRTNIAGSNNVPVASDQSVTTPEDTSVDITLSATDADGDPLTYSIVDVPSNGTVTLSANTATYTPDANYNGADSFTFKANDGTVDSNTATVSITVAGINNAPIASDQSITTPEDTSVDITLSATDADGDALTYSIVDVPSNGTVTLSANTATYTPDANYIGADSFTFKANDGTDDSNTATVSITVTGVNDAPVVDDQSVTTPEDTSADITLSATDADGDPLTYSIVDVPSHGTVTLSGNTATYTPDANYNGADSFTFKVNDGTDDSNTATVSITVTGVNNAPIASDQSVTTPEDTSVDITLSATDADGDALTYSIVDVPSNGTVTLSANTATYTPDANYNGADSFTFKANDGFVDSNTATVSITVTGVNDAPVVDDQSVTTPEDTSVDITLSATDADGDSLTYSIVDVPSNGTVTLSANTATYTPDANYNGADSFTFKANDGTDDSNTATVSITVTGVNDAPVADPNGSYTGTEGIPVTFDGSGSYDPDGTIDSYDWDFGDENSGSGVNPSHTYTQDGIYTLTLTVTDNDGATDSNSTTVVVGNIAPTVTIHSPPSVTNDSMPLLFATFDQITASIWYVLDNGDKKPEGFNTDNLTVTFPELPDGQHTVTVYANNSYGNVGSATQDFLVDTIAPAVTINRVTSLTNVSSLTITGNFTESGSGIDSITVNGIEANISDSNYSAIISLTEGLNSVDVVAIDNASNTGSNATSIVLDTIAPELTLELVTEGNDNTLYIYSSEELLKCTVTLPNESIQQCTNLTPFNFNWSSRLTLNGLHLLCGIDEAGNQALQKLILEIGIINATDNNQTNYTTGKVTFDITTTHYVNDSNITICEYDENPVGSLNATTLSLLGINEFVQIEVDPDLNDSIGTVRISINYSGADLSEIDEDSLKLYVWNASIKKWEELEPSGIDKVKTIVWGELDHLSLFGILGEEPEDVQDDDDNGDSSGGSSGGIGGGASGELYENIACSETDWQYVSQNSDISYSFEMECNIVQYINFTSLTDTGKIATKVEILKDTSALVDNPPSDIVYENLNIWFGNAGWETKRNIDDATVVFTVDKSWITKNNIDESSIALCRYSDDTWHKLVTRKIAEDTNSLQFEAETPGFSPFAVTGKELEGEPGGEGIIAEPTVTAEKTPTEEKGIPGFSLFAGLSILLIAVQLLRKKE